MNTDWISESATRGLFALGLILAALLATSACGFKLRGGVEIPPELSPLFVQPQRSAVRDQLVQRLQGLQVQLAAGPRQAWMIVRISNERRSSRVIAVDRNGKVLAKELRYGLTFDAVAPDGKQLVPPQSFNLIRSSENSNIEVLGKRLETELIYGDMIRDAADRILFRLRTTVH